MPFVSLSQLSQVCRADVISLQRTARTFCLEVRKKYFLMLFSIHPCVNVKHSVANLSLLFIHEVAQCSSYDLVCDQHNEGVQERPPGEADETGL